MSTLSHRDNEELDINREYEDAFTSASSNLDFPRTVAQAILDNLSNLERLVKDINSLGSYHFEAGYDIIPEGNKTLMPEDACYFMGNSSSS
jgi:hypothetical protein